MLTAEDWRCYAIGVNILTRRYVSIADIYQVNIDCDGYVCNEAKQKMYNDLLAHHVPHSYHGFCWTNVLGYLLPVLDSMSYGVHGMEDVCLTCQSSIRTAIGKIMGELWEELPQIFLPEDDDSGSSDEDI